MNDSRSSTQVSWCVELSLHPGQFDAFRQLTVEMVQAVQCEPGTLNFERFVSEDRSTVHVYERYVDSDAAILHLLEFRGRFASRFAPLVERKRFSLYGEASTELIELLNRMLTLTPPQHYSRIDGRS